MHNFLIPWDFFFSGSHFKLGGGKVHTLGGMKKLLHIHTQTHHMQGVKRFYIWYFWEKYKGLWMKNNKMWKCSFIVQHVQEVSFVAFWCHWCQLPCIWWTQQVSLGEMCSTVVQWQFKWHNLSVFMTFWALTMFKSYKHAVISPPPGTSTWRNLWMTAVYGDMQ